MKYFLVLGRTGVGKSSFINAVFGKEVARTSSDEACTKIVSHYAYNGRFGDFCLIDTPGLGEDDLKLDKYYLNLVTSFIKDKSIFRYIFVTPVTETRLRAAEKQTIRLLTEELGRDVWNSAWLVLTFAGLLEETFIHQAAMNRIHHIKAYLSVSTNNEFNGFDETILIDNKTKNWTDKKVVPINKIIDR